MCSSNSSMYTSFSLVDHALPPPPSSLYPSKINWNGWLIYCKWIPRSILWTEFQFTFWLGLLDIDTWISQHWCGRRAINSLDLSWKTLHEARCGQYCKSNCSVRMSSIWDKRLSCYRWIGPYTITIWQRKCACHALRHSILYLALLVNVSKILWKETLGKVLALW